jgi:hypothetical protein
MAELSDGAAGSLPPLETAPASRRARSALVLATILGCCVGFAAHAQNKMGSPDTEWRESLPCASWCNVCRATYSCYQECAARRGQRVEADCGRLRPFARPRPPIKWP